MSLSSDKRKKQRGRLLAITLIGAVFIGVGWALSDARYYRQLVTSNGLHTPQQVFNWVTSHIPSAKNAGVPVKNFTSIPPRLTLEHRRTVYCDEGAIVVATLCHVLRYETRLVDLIGLDSISHHTILEVKEDTGWVTYDFLNAYRAKKYQECVDYQLLTVVYRPYPTAYNSLLNANYFVKKTALKVRGIDEASAIKTLN